MTDSAISDINYISRNLKEPGLSNSTIYALKVLIADDGNINMNEYRKRISKKMIQSVQTMGQDITAFYDKNGKIKPYQDIFKEIDKRFSFRFRMLTVAEESKDISWSAFIND